jgi:hypothetical protein
MWWLRVEFRSSGSSVCGFSSFTHAEAKEEGCSNYVAWPLASHSQMGQQVREAHSIVNWPGPGAGGPRDAASFTQPSPG